MIENLPKFKKNRKTVYFFDSNNKEFAALIRTKHDVYLVNCVRQQNGKMFYQFGLSEAHKPLFGLDGLGYIATNEAIIKLANHLGV